MSFRAKIYAVNAAKILRSKAHLGKESSIFRALKAGKDKWMQLMETGWDIDKFWNGVGAAQMNKDQEMLQKEKEWVKKEQYWRKREEEWLLRAAKVQQEINKITEESKLSREIDYDALGSWLLLRLGLIDAGAKLSGGLYSLSQKSAEEGVTQLLKASSGVDSRESSDSLKALEISVAEISKQQKVMFTIQKEMKASLDRLVSPGPRSAPTLLSSTLADTVDTSTTPADTADTTPVADTPSSTTTPSSAASDVDDTPEPTDIF